ncbi:DUF2281 domain-containing protein [Azospirillum sp. YIM B02556]|uniref:DUF2281 domain-containing protein n=1 Tax=Azospirillum endophyticum TaxID=2800326 RepID=A0ABS1F462_9PROT|nr:DUF2281 domain-containing protein [Azospirillum endophyticum]MBK1838206.1 DUF2281 domain-containing protein [Azospirillum endophyticum]
MGYAELIRKLQALPEDKQTEVFDFVEFLTARFAASKEEGKEEWSEEKFAEFGMEQAMRGMEDDPVTYGRDDLRKVWR